MAAVTTDASNLRVGILKRLREDHKWSRPAAAAIAATLVPAEEWTGSWRGRKHDWLSASRFNDDERGLAAFLSYTLREPFIAIGAKLSVAESAEDAENILDGFWKLMRNGA